MSNKQEQPKTFWLQQGSFRISVVEDEKANQEWRRKPFRVIEIFALELKQAELDAAQAQIAELKEKLLNFEGQTFSENQRIVELEAQNKKLVEALKLANDILSKNSIYYGDLAEFYKLLIELEIR